MCWRVTLLAAATLALATSQTACFDVVDTEFPDGMLCSASGTCPPGQQCSFDGMCLRSCPTVDCTGRDCGCDDLNTYGNNYFIFTCAEDGLCHLRCDEGGGCINSMFCDSGQGQCKQSCYGDEQYCPPGTVCVMDPQGSHCDVEACAEECDSRCVELDSDAAHCGRCGHDCLGGDCVDGRCQPAPLMDLSWYPEGGALQVTQDTVYWAVESAGWAIRACAATGCAEPETICWAPYCGQPAKLTVSADMIYWRDVSTGDDRILRCPLTGCASTPEVVIEQLGSSLGPLWNGDGLYFLASDGLQRCPGGDCSSGPEHLYDFTPVAGDASFSADDTRVVVSLCAADQVLACPKTGCGGAPSVIWNDPGSGGCPQHPRLMGGQVYFVLRQSGLVWRCPVTGCGDTPEMVGTIPLVSGQAVTSFKLSPHGAYAVDPNGALWHCDIGAEPTGCAIYWQGDPIKDLSVNPQAVFFSTTSAPRVFRLAPP